MRTRPAAACGASAEARCAAAPSSFSSFSCVLALFVLLLLLRLPPPAARFPCGSASSSSRGAEFTDGLWRLAGPFAERVAGQASPVIYKKQAIAYDFYDGPLCCEADAKCVFRDAYYRCGQDVHAHRLATASAAAGFGGT